MKQLLLVLLFTPSLAFAQSGEFRGHDAMETLLKDRVLGVDPNFLLLSLFQFQEAPYDFKNLLGSFNPYSISTGKIENGTPNAFNMILWHTIMTNLSSRMGRECQMGGAGKDAIVIQPNISQSLLQLCQWPLPTAKNKDIYETLFTDITVFDVPFDEFEAWYDHFVASGNYDGLAPEPFITMVMYPLLMNPHLLLQP